MSQGCLFCAIVSGESESARVGEESGAVAFLDSRPLFPGHCLVVPRTHVAHFSELAAEQVGPLFAFVRRISGAVEVATGSEGSFIAMNNKVSQSVPHLHVHVVPRKRKDGLKGFFWPRRRYGSEQEMREMAERIRRELER